MRLCLGEKDLLFGRELGEVGIDVFQAAVFGDELGGAHFSHALHARYIVGCISADGQHVNDLGGFVDTPFLTEGGGVHQLVVRSALAGLELENVFPDELSVVFVGSNHIDVQIIGGQLRGCAAQDIIGLEAGNHHDGNVHGLDQLRKGLQRIDDELRGRGTRAFVGGVHFVAESAARRVERHGHVRRLLPFNEFQDVFRESEEDGHVRPLGIDHRPSQECVVHLEYQRMSVYEE